MVALAEHLPRDRFAVEFPSCSCRGATAPVEAQAAGSEGPKSSVWPSARRSETSTTGRGIAVGVDSLRAGHYDILDAWLLYAYAIAAVTRPLSRVPVLVAGRRSMSGFKEGSTRSTASQMPLPGGPLTRSSPTRAILCDDVTSSPHDDVWTRPGSE